MRTSEEFYRCYVQAFPGFSLIRIQGALHMAERRLNTMFTTSSWLNLLEYVTLMLLRPVSYTHLRVTEASKGSLRMVGNHSQSAKAEGSLTARPTGRAGTKVGLSDPAV